MINYLYHLLHLILKMPALCLYACSQTTSPLLHCAFNNSVIKKNINATVEGAITLSPIPL